MSLLATLAVVACGEMPAPGQQDRPGRAQSSPPFAGPAGQLAWEGVLACADCDGIEMRLVIDRDATDPIVGAGDAQPRYELLETFLADQGGERFREQGQWRRDGRLLRLQADGGGERVFAIEPDGRLSLRDADGGAPRGPVRLLVPVTAPSQ